MSPKLGFQLIRSQKQDFDNIVDYYKDYKINSSFFEEANLNLICEAHKFAFAVSLFINKITNITEYGKPYLNQLKSDSISLILTLFFGNKRAFKLHERLIIENLFRYLYYNHHEIEHKLLQIEPSNYISFEKLFDYAKSHPYFLENKELLCSSIDVLKSKYSDLSRQIHASTLNEMSLIENLKSLNNSTLDLQKEKEELKIIIQNILFILCYFNRDDIQNLDINERPIITSLLTKKQIHLLSKLI